MKFTSIAALLALAIATPGIALAQNNASNQAAAQGLFDEAMRFFEQGEFASACEKFEASLALVDGVGTKGKLAECYEKVGRTASAWAAYREVAVLAGRDGQDVRRDVASKRAERLKPLLAYLTIVVEPDSKVEGLQVARNGAEVVSGSYGSAIAVDPGSYEIIVSAPGYESKTLNVDVAKTAKQSVTIPSLVKLPEEASNNPDLIPSAGSQSQNSGSSLIGMTTVGVGSLTVLGGIFLGLSAKSDYDSAFDSECNSDNECSPAGKTIVDDARTKANIATVISVSGLAIAGVGTYLWLRSRKGEREQAQAFQLVPTISNESGGLSILGQF